MQELKAPKPRKVDQAKGAAAGMADAMADAAGVDAAVNGARQRLLEADQPKPSLPQVSPGAAPQHKLSGEFIQHSSGARVPREFYDLSPDAQKRFLASLEQKQEEAAAESRFDNVALRVLDEIDKLRGQVKGLESSLLAAVGVIEQQKQQLEAIDTSLKVEKSAALAEQQALLGDAVVNAAAVEASLRNQTTQSQSELERQRDDHRARMEATERVLSDHEGRIKANATLMTERGNAVVDQVAAAEGRQVRLGVTLTEMEGRTDALGTPITRGEVEQFTRDAIERELSGQVTDERIKRVVAQNFTVAAPSSSVDAMNPKPVEMVANVANERTEREVQAAINRSRR